MAEKTGTVDSPRVQERRPLASMSRHRFLMLGASIVGVGLLPFAQRNYAYAQDITVTPYNYAPRKGFDNTDHTAVLYKMFSDRRLKPPYHFHLPPRLPDPNIPGDPGGWMVTMGRGFTTFPVESRWTLTGKTLDAVRARKTLDPETLRRSTLPNGTVLDPASALYRKGEVVHGDKMFHNTDTTSATTTSRSQTSTSGAGSMTGPG